MELLRLASRLATSPQTVLIYGEPGTGKEQLARAIHRASRRRGLFIPVNAASLTPELADSELFGYLKGAFTSASADRTGLIAMAERGTLFLDEIGELPLEVQPKLLRFLQERTIRPLGAGREQAIDVRIVAATNRDLEQAVRDGMFRRDLYDRLAEYLLLVPPLRERGNDVLLLARSFLDQLTGDRGPIKLTRAAAAALWAHPWPGNVRELQRVVRALHLGGLEGGIGAQDVYRVLRGNRPSAGGAETEEMLLRVLAERGHATPTELCLDLRTSRSSLYRLLDRFVESGRIERTRAGREAIYRLAGAGTMAVARDIGGTRAEEGSSGSTWPQGVPPGQMTAGGAASSESTETSCEIALRLAGAGGVSRLELVDATGLSPRSASRLLSRLEEEGLLRQVGAGRSIRYVLRRSEPG